MYIYIFSLLLFVCRQTFGIQSDPSCASRAISPSCVHQIDVIYFFLIRPIHLVSYTASFLGNWKILNSATLAQECLTGQLYWTLRKIKKFDLISTCILKYFLICRHFKNFRYCSYVSHASKCRPISDGLL